MIQIQLGNIEEILKYIPEGTDIIIGITKKIENI